MMIAVMLFLHHLSVQCTFVWECSDVFSSPSVCTTYVCMSQLPCLYFLFSLFFFSFFFLFFISLYEVWILFLIFSFSLLPLACSFVFCCPCGLPLFFFLTMY